MFSKLSANLFPYEFRNFVQPDPETRFSSVMENALHAKAPRLFCLAITG